MKNVFFLFLSLLCVGCGKKDPSTLTVGATPVPHAQILEFVKPQLKEQGIHLKIVEITDYNVPNRALAEKEIDANFFQHIPFMNEQIKEFDYSIQCFAKIHLEPMAVFSNKIGSLKNIKQKAIIAIPNDPTNEYRALALLEKEGLIQLDVGQNLQATVANIISNPKQLRFQEVDAALLTRTLKDVDAAVIPMNFALQAGLDPEEDALAVESKHSPYANILTIRIGDEDNPHLQALKKAMLTEEMRDYILKEFKGNLIPILEECPLKSR